MKAKFWAFAFITLLVVGMSTAAKADANPFTFNVDYCSNPCLGGVPASNNGGTVTLTQVNTTTVKVDVELASGLFFHHAVSGNNPLNSFAFNISGNPTVSASILDAGGGTWSSLIKPAGNTDGAGSTFGYAFNCTNSGGGVCDGSPSKFIFQISVASGALSLSSFETLSGASGTTTNVDFAANVANGTCTGMIGAGNGVNDSTPATVGSAGTACGGTTTTPEPGMISLFGVALAGAAAALRRKLFA